MAHRLSSIVTRTGDDGSTGLADGTRTRKDSLRIEAIGTVDELNAQIGLLLAEMSAELPAEPASGELRDDFVQVQQDLFDLGAELALPGQARLPEDRVERLDVRIAQINARLPRLEEFILPGGTRTAAQTHVCRTVCRRAERVLVRLAQAEPVGETSRRYLNRLSDLLFVAARAIQRASGGAEPQWKPAADGGGDLV